MDGDGANPSDPASAHLMSQRELCVAHANDVSLCIQVLLWTRVELG